jgi:hypothetical protein
LLFLEIVLWLEELGMERYQQLFIKEELYKDVLEDISEDLLENLGIKNSKHRSKIIKACNKMKGKYFII